MTPNLKALGIALAAILAIGAIAVNAASAAEFEFHSDGSPTKLTGSQTTEGVFKFAAGSISCKKVTYSGEMTSTVTPEIELEPNYEECTAFGVLATVIDRNGCRYRYVQEKKTMPGPDFDTTDYLVCPKVGGVTQEMTITIGAPGTVKCTIHIPEQDVGTTATWTNSSGKLKMKIVIRNYVYTQTKGTGLGSCASTSGTEGEYTGEGTVEGLNSEGKSTEIWVE